MCICAIKIKEDKFSSHYLNLQKIANKYCRGISFRADWSDPLIDSLKSTYHIISFSDSPTSNDCELFMLPDGWFFNGNTNFEPFAERIKCLKDIIDYLTNNGFFVDIYIGWSGLDRKDFYDIKIKPHNLVSCLTSTIGQHGSEFGLHISIAF